MGRRLILLCLLLGITAAAAAAADRGTIKLTIIDAQSGNPTPGRLHVKDASGAFVIADDPVLFGGDCDMSDAGAGYTDLISAFSGFTDRLNNPYTDTTQFYSDGKATLSVPAGTTEISVYKGPEYRVATSALDVKPGQTIEHTVKLQRWVDMPARGWYSADDHLHIQRPHPDLNPRILLQMQAEDIHVANLLQMGKVRNFDIAPQYAFGKPGHYQEGKYILAAGQENPRSHYLGHTITLGAPEPIFNADKYLIYRLIWEASTAQGGLNGFAHAGFASGPVSPYEGLGVLLQHDLLHFLEVLQFNRSGYQVWYDVLNLGFKVAPTAGTDYPCADQNIPGHERFYTQVDGTLNYSKWLQAVRAGRTFVTTGPIVELTVDDAGMGGEVMLDAPGEVRIRGSVTFDPARDEVSAVELIQNGGLVHRVTPAAGADRIDLDLVRRVDETSWFALRAYGSERSHAGFASPFHFAMLSPTSNAHTGAIYVTLKGHPALAESARSRDIARAWLARLYDLESTLEEANLARLGARLETPDFDGVPTQTLINNRTALLAEIEVAKRYFAALARRDK